MPRGGLTTSPTPDRTNVPPSRIGEKRTPKRTASHEHKANPNGLPKQPSVDPRPTALVSSSPAKSGDRSGRAATTRTANHYQPRPWTDHPFDFIERGWRRPRGGRCPVRAFADILS